MAWANGGASGWQPGPAGPWGPDRPGRRGPSPLARLLIPAILAFAVQVPFTIAQASRSGWGTPAVVDVIAAIAGPLALLLSRRLPGPVVAFCGVAALADLLLVSAPMGFVPPPVALAFAVILAIVRGARIWALATLGVIWVTILVLLGLGETPFHPARTVVFGFGLLLAFGAGEFLRSRRERWEQYRARAQQQRRTAEQDERVRIARELHDVLAHSLSSINVQAGVALHLLDSQPERAGEALAAIKTASKDALDEVRSVIGVLRSDDRADDAAPRRPEPGLADLDDLAEPLRSSGVEVRLSVQPGIAPPTAVQLALYRIAQESLTNALRHANARSVTVEVAQTELAVELTVTDDGSGAPAKPGGSGLLGMQERAALLGGSLEAGPIDGGFRVHAVLPSSPTHASAPTASATSASAPSGEEST
jgi:signal transduction histidine kinase